MDSLSADRLNRLFLKNLREAKPSVRYCTARDSNPEPGSPAEAAMLKDLKGNHEREMDAKQAAVATGKNLTELLARIGEDVLLTDLLKWLHFVDGGGGPDNAYLIWTDLKVSLQCVAGRQKRPKSPKTTADDSDKVREAQWWLSKSLLTLKDHSDWSMAKIAKQVGVSKSTLSRSREFKIMYNTIKRDKNTMPRGTKDADGNLDAWEDSPST